MVEKEMRPTLPSCVIVAFAFLSDGPNAPRAS